MIHDIVVVGAGAAGLMAATFAAGTGRSVLVIERTPDGGRKILISGGGRCNVLPSALAPDRFVTDSPRPIMRAMLRSWPLHEQRDFFERGLGVPLVLEPASGKLFPLSNRARDVRDALVEQARRAGATFRFNTALTGLSRREPGWLLRTTTGEITTGAVVLATGGLSVPATGSDGAGLRLAASLDHRIHQVYPALTPLLADPPIHATLSGVSLHVRVRTRENGRTIESTGGFLFTHRGYSGPAVLDVSHVAVRSLQAGGGRAILRVQWTPLDAAAWESALISGSRLVATTISAYVPQRLATRLMEESGIPLDRRASELRRGERGALVERLTSYVLPWTGDEGFKKAEVTGGGVVLDEVDPRTLESRRQPGLFLCGEMLDAFGPIGGHNFAWAWSTGRLAGLGAAGSASPDSHDG
jgi:predicted Rossmann fold flavoprotein